MASQASEEILVSQLDAELEKFVVEEMGQDHRITLIEAGTTGLSFAALHLKHLNDPSQLIIYDTRPDLRVPPTFTMPSNTATSSTTPLLSLSPCEMPQ